MTPAEARVRRLETGPCSLEARATGVSINGLRDGVRAVLDTLRSAGARAAGRRHAPAASRSRRRRHPVRRCAPGSSRQPISGYPTVRVPRGLAKPGADSGPATCQMGCRLPFSRNEPTGNGSQAAACQRPEWLGAADRAHSGVQRPTPGLAGLHDRSERSATWSSVKMFGYMVAHTVLGLSTSVLDNVGVASPGRDQVEHLVLPARSAREHDLRARRTSRGEELDDPQGHGGPEDRLTAGDGGHRPH